MTKRESLPTGGSVKLLRTLGIFSITLVSYYDYTLNVTWGYLIGVAILFIDAIIMQTRYSHLKKEKHKYNYVIILLLIIYILTSSFIGSVHNKFDILPFRSATFVLSLILLYCGYVYYKIGIKCLLRPLTITLIVHMLFFYIQLILVGIFSLEIDFIEPITGETQRIFGGTYDVGLFSQFFRPAGLFAEPGTYANMIFLLFLVREVIRTGGDDYKIPHNKDLLITAFLVISLVLSFSVFAYIFILVFVFSLLIKSKARGKTSILLFAVLSPFIGVAAIYIEQRFSLGDASGTGFRYEGILILLGNLDMINGLVGWGFLSDYERLNYNITFNDLGLLFNIFLQCGLFGLIIWSYIFKKLFKFNAPEFALAITLQLTKFTLTYPVVWLALILIVNVASKHAKRREIGVQQASPSVAPRHPIIV